MSAPVATDNLVQGAYKFLAAQGPILAVLGAFPDHTPWLFQNTSWVTVEGSGSTAAVLSHGGSWSGSNPHNTMRFPRLSLEIYVDPQRDDANNATDPGEAHRRVEVAFAAFDRVLHRVAGGPQMWGTVRTVSSTRLAEPTVYPTPDGDGMLRLQAFYAVGQG
jgi:hypothetical protein